MHGCPNRTSKPQTTSATAARGEPPANGFALVAPSVEGDDLLAGMAANSITVMTGDGCS